MVESSIRRKTNEKELDVLLAVVEYSLNSDRVFGTNEEKTRCLDSLWTYSERVNDIAFYDSLITIISGSDTCMQRRISQSHKALKQSIKWISRLNDFYTDEIQYEHKEEDKGTIKLIGLGSDETSVLNIAFRIVEKPENIICTFVQVVCNNEITYSQAFEINELSNCINVPYAHNKGEMIELGYIVQGNETITFKYITYGK